MLAAAAAATRCTPCPHSVEERRGSPARCAAQFRIRAAAPARAASSKSSGPTFPAALLISLCPQCLPFPFFDGYASFLWNIHRSLSSLLWNVHRNVFSCLVLRRLWVCKQMFVLIGPQLQRTRVLLSPFVRYNPGACKQFTKPQVAT